MTSRNSFINSSAVKNFLLQVSLLAFDMQKRCLVFKLRLFMQNIEEQALATHTRTVPLWLRYVDDTFTAVHKDGIDDFHEHLNRQNADIQFTKEIEENGKIPFLDCLVTRDNNRLKIDILQKTNTYRPITRPVFVQPDLSQGYYYRDSDETSATSLRLT